MTKNRIKKEYNKETCVLRANGRKLSTTGNRLFLQKRGHNLSMIFEKWERMFSSLETVNLAVDGLFRYENGSFLYSTNKIGCIGCERFGAIY